MLMQFMSILYILIIKYGLFLTFLILFYIKIEKYNTKFNTNIYKKM